MATQTVYDPWNDPWATADDPQFNTSYDYFGQVKVDSYFCILVKGTGKVPFDAQAHAIDQRRTAIDIQIFPLAEMNISFDVSRNMIAESREWAGIVLPSIKALNLSLRDLNNKWVHVVTEKTGQTYTGKDGNTKDKTTFKFLAVFPDEASCRAAYQAAANGTPAPAPATPVNGNGNGASKERETAAKFLPVIVTNACAGQTDLTVIRNSVAAAIANMPMVSKHFTVDSTEVMTLIMEKMSK